MNGRKAKALRQRAARDVLVAHGNTGFGSVYRKAKKDYAAERSDHRGPGWSAAGK